jgi:hypothetical protein
MMAGNNGGSTNIKLMHILFNFKTITPTALPVPVLR